jgi:polyhydroxyalkanoate synthesis regulator phasin
MSDWVIAFITFGVLFTAFAMRLAVEELRTIENQLSELVDKVVREPESQERAREEYDKLVEAGEFPPRQSDAEVVLEELGQLRLLLVDIRSELSLANRDPDKTSDELLKELREKYPEAF